MPKSKAKQASPHRRRPKIDRPKKKPGNPPHIPTDAARGLVRYLVILGRTHEQIARAAGIDPKTLRKYYGDELDTAWDRTGALLMQTAVMRAVGGPDQRWQDADPSMIKYLLSSKFGVSEKTQINHSGAVGTYDLSKLTDEELAQLDRIHARLAGAAVDASPGGDRETSGGT